MAFAPRLGRLRRFRFAPARGCGSRRWRRWASLARRGLARWFRVRLRLLRRRVLDAVAGCGAGRGRPRWIGRLRPRGRLLSGTAMHDRRLGRLRPRQRLTGLTWWRPGTRCLSLRGCLAWWWPGTRCLARWRCLAWWWRPRTLRVIRPTRWPRTVRVVVGIAVHALRLYASRWSEPVVRAAFTAAS